MRPALATGQTDPNEAIPRLAAGSVTLIHPLRYVEAGNPLRVNVWFYEGRL